MPPMKVLFICTGNTCRSVMAEHLLNHMSKEKGLGWTARSCGVAAERYFQVPPGVHRALKAAGVSVARHAPKLVSRELLSWADLSLAMTRAHRDAVVDEFPEFSSKVHVLRSYAGLPEPDIADPIGAPDEVYARCRDVIQEALEALLRKDERAQSPRP